MSRFLTPSRFVGMSRSLVMSRSLDMSRLLSVAALSLTCTVCVSAQEKHIAESQLPPAVLKTVQQQSQGAVVKGYSTEREHGQKVYEAEMMVQGHSKDIQVAADGSLNEVEEEVDLHTLPQNVQAGLAAKASGAKITKVESLTKQGKLVAYEAATLRGSHKGEVQVGPAGEPLQHEE